jgi:hypothetical protein
LLLCFGFVYMPHPLLSPPSTPTQQHTLLKRFSKANQHESWTTTSLFAHATLTCSRACATGKLVKGLSS